MSTFSINGSTPPAHAKPTAPTSRWVIYPEPTGYDGNGAPAGAVGPLEAEIGRSVMSAAGWTWWMNYFNSTPTALSVAVTNVVLYDSVTESWRTFATGTMHRPSHGSYNPGVWYEDVRVKFTNLVAA